MSKNYCYYCKCEVGEFNKDNPYILLTSSHHVYICFACAKSNMPQELFNFLTAPRNTTERETIPIPVFTVGPKDPITTLIDWNAIDSVFAKLSVAAFDTGSLGSR